MTSPELAALDPDVDIITFEDGSQLQIEELRLRQLFKLLKIVTRGAGPLLFDSRLSLTGTPEEIALKFMTILGFALPEAEDEAIEFIVSMIAPVGTVDGRKLTEQERKHNQKLLEALIDEWQNPDPVKAIEVIEHIVKREAEDLGALAKKLMTMFSMGKKTGQISEDIPVSVDQTSSETSADNSI